MLNVALYSLLAVTTLLLACTTTKTATGELPEPVAELRETIQPLEPDAIYDVIVVRFGREARDIGSGRRIPQWEVAGGLLTLPRGSGPTFEPADGPAVYLLRTRNPARECVLTSYEITSKPDVARHGTRYWLGNVELQPDGGYRYTDAGNGFSEREEGAANFFLSHPAGRFEVEWSPGVGDDALLEEVGERMIARLTFTADDSTTFRTDLTSSTTARRLEFSGPTFEAGGGWRHWVPRDGNGPATRAG